MKGLKLVRGIIFIFIFLLLIPKGSCASSVNDTVFLTPGQATNFYFIQASEDDVVQWSFHTYNDSFNVNAFALNFWGLISSDKTSDSGSVEAYLPGSYTFTFYFQNAGSASGYIDINIHIREETIEGYYPLIFIIIFISIISMVSIKKKGVKIHTRKNAII